MSCESYESLSSFLFFCLAKFKNKKNKEQNKKDQEQQKQDNNQQKQEKISKDNAERMLDAADQQEKATRKKMEKAMSQPQRRNLQKNW